MTIKISQLGAVATLQGNTIIPMVSNLTGTLTTVQANMTQISNFITGGSSGGYGNIVPSANLTYSLGSPTQWWKDIYVSSNTIYVGGTALSVSDGTLSLDGYAVAGKDAATTPVGTVAGTYWHYANSGLVSDQLRTSAYGAGKFVAWLTGGYFPNVAIYSSDGINWTQTSTPNVAQTSQQVTFGSDKFVAIYTTTGNTATSTDGITWTFNQDVIPPYGVYGYEFYKNLVAYGNGRFVALTGYTTRRSVISTDGITWSNGAMSLGSVDDLPATDRQGQSLLYQSLAFTSGVFVASATRANGTGGNLIAYTTDGVTWGNIQLPWGHDLTSGYILGAGGGAFVGVPNASGNVGIRSTDGGRTWSNISLPEPFTYTSVLYGNGQFILLSADTNTNIAISSDGGVTWSEVNTPYNAYYSGAYGDNTFIATGIIAGNVFNISYSTAGVDATPIGATTPSTARFTNVTVTTDLVVSGDITSPTITDLYANVIAANTGMKGYVDSVSGSESIANVNMKGYVDGQISAANSAVVTANIGMIGYVGSQVTAANTSANTANIAMVGYVNNQVTTVVTTANVGMKGYVDNAVIQVGGSTYGNANVAQFLPSYSGNIGQLLTTDDLLVAGSITAGFALPTITFANVIFNGIGLANSYAQLNIQNLDSVGTQNSADFIATAPNGTDTSRYIDMGINGNNYSSSSWTVSGKNDGYVYINSGNLTLGTDTADTTVKVHVGGTLAANVVSTFGSNGLSVAGNVTGTYFIGDGSQLTNLPGGGGYSNVQVATYLPTYSGNVANVRLDVSGVLTFADGTTQTTASAGGSSSYSNVNVAAYLNTTGYNLYSNANVASYLPTYSGDIANITLGASGEITFNQSSYVLETDIVDGNLTPTGYHSLSLNSSNNGILVLNALDSNSAVSSSVTVANTSAQINVNNQIWTFGNDGNLTLPRQLFLPNGAVLKDTPGDSVSLGNGAGYNTQGDQSVAIGREAAETTQGARSVAIGVRAGQNSQGISAVAIGDTAGNISQGNYAIAIGYQAGQTNQSANSIAINSSLSVLYANVSGLFINPVRQDDSNAANVVYYNTVTKEMTYSSVANISFTMANVTHWTSNVYTVSDALNQLAERIWNIENP